MIDVIKDDCLYLQYIIIVEGICDGWFEYMVWCDEQLVFVFGMEMCDDDDVIQLYMLGIIGLFKGVMLINVNYKLFMDQVGMLEWVSYLVGDNVMNVMFLFYVVGVNVGIFVIV